MRDIASLFGVAHCELMNRYWKIDISEEILGNRYKETSKGIRYNGIGIRK